MTRPTATEIAKMRAQKPDVPLGTGKSFFEEQTNSPFAPGGATEPTHSTEAPILPNRPAPRTPEETAADLQKLGQGIREYREKAEEKKQPEKTEKSEEEEDWWSWEENDLLANSKRRKKIEARLKPLDMEAYLFQGEVRQAVPIGELYEMELRSLSIDEDLEIKRMLGSMTGSERYINDKYSVMSLTAGLYRINDRILPNHLDSNGNFDEDRFNEKLKAVRKYPSILGQDLVVNWMWFTDRIKKLLSLEDLGNG